MQLIRETRSGSTNPEFTATTCGFGARCWGIKKNINFTALYNGLKIWGVRKTGDRIPERSKARGRSIRGSHCGYLGSRHPGCLGRNRNMKSRTDCREQISPAKGVAAAGLWKKDF